jgi:non-ribosomal peptide synthase protein (TIGR01720 family)
MTSSRRHLKERLPEYMQPSAIMVLTALPLTANGKIDRRALPAPTLEQVSSRGYVAPRTEQERTLCEIWSSVLRLPRVGVEDNFFEIGGDSILCSQIVARCRKIGLRVTARQLFAHQTIAALAPHVASAVEPSAGSGAAKAAAATDRRSDAIPLTPIQRRFFATGGSGWHHDNQHVLLSVDPSIPCATWDRCLEALTNHHAAFRLRFRPAFTGPEARLAGAGPHHSLRSLDLTNEDAAARQRALADANAIAQSSFDLDRGPLLAAVHARMPAGDRAQLLLVTHHLVIDGVSWRIVLGDLAALLEQSAAGRVLDLGEPGTPFHEWARRLDEWAGRVDWDTELAPWLGVPAAAGASSADLRRLLDREGPAVTDRVADEETLRFTIDEPATTKLIEAGGRLVRAPLDRALLAALVDALSASSPQAAWWMDVEGHGRDLELPDVDLGRTVGWFTSIYPVRLEAAAPDASTTTLQQIDETLRAVPSGGIAFGLASSGRAPATVTARLHSLLDRGILFNYLGRFDEGGDAFSTGDGGLGGSRALERLRTHPLVVEAAVVHGRLEVEFCFAGAQLDPAKVQDLADAMRRRLLAAAGGGRFPAARVPAAELDALVARVDGRGGLTVADVYELTPMQGGMLFHRLFDAAGSVYFEQFSFVLEEAVDAPALREA